VYIVTSLRGVSGLTALFRVSIVLSCASLKLIVISLALAV
jgi:hypothetical protein